VASRISLTLASNHIFQAGDLSSLSSTLSGRHSVEKVRSHPVSHSQAEGSAAAEGPAKANHVTPFQPDYLTAAGFVRFLRRVALAILRPGRSR
jgi:hypothetical protein